MAQQEVQREHSGRLLTDRCLNYLDMDPEVPVGNLNDQPWRHNATVNFLRARRADVDQGNADYLDPLELNAVGGATLESGYAEARNEPRRTRYLRERSQHVAGQFFGAVLLKAEADPSFLDDEQVYKAGCFRIAAKYFTKPRTKGALLPVHKMVRYHIARRLVQVQQQLAAKPAEAEDEQQAPQLAGLYNVRAELLTAAVLMRKVDDYEPFPDRAIALPALTRHSRSFYAGTVDHKWGVSMWRLNSDAAQKTGLGLETPPDRKLRIKQRGNWGNLPEQNPSIVYINLLSDIVHTEDEGRIGKIAISLKREVNQSRHNLDPGMRDELDFVTRNARRKVGIDD